MKYKLILINLLILCLISFAGCEDDSSSVIETLDGEKITVKKFETSYETAIESMSRMQNIEKENLIKIVASDIEELDEQLKQVNYRFQPKNFYDEYRNTYMIKTAADKSGFSTRADIKNIVKYLEMQTISQLYIQEQVEKKIKISDEDASAKCKELREKEAQMKSVTLDKCLQFGRGFLKQEQSRKILPDVLQRVKEEISVKHNDKFDLDQYLKTGPSILKKEMKEKEKEKASDSKSDPTKSGEKPVTPVSK
jgi:hypothetical protein